MNTKPPLHIAYFSDVLCVWAYAAQIRVDELKSRFGEQIRISYHFLPVFGCTETRIGEAWAERGGYPAYGEHVRGICEGFPHLQVHPEIWERNIPRASASAHHFLKAVQSLEEDGLIDGHPQAAFAGRNVFEELAWRLRLAFFRDLEDVGTQDIQMRIADELGLPRAAIEQRLHDGEAMAAMCRDLELRDRYRVDGSPTYVLNHGRQKLYGNVGYKIIEANVHEVLYRPENQASWC